MANAYKMRSRNEDAGQRRERLAEEAAEIFQPANHVLTCTWIRWEREVQSLADMIGEDIEVVRQAIIDDGYMIQSGF